MLYRIPWALLLACLFAWPLGAADEAKKEATSDKEEAEVKPPPVKGKWTPVGALMGQVKTATPNSLTLTVEYQDMQQNANPKNKTNPNNNASRQMQNFQNQLNSANRIKNPAQKIARIQQIQAQMQAAGMRQAMQQANNFKMVTKKKDVDLVMSNEVQVRVANPPQEFDEKGQQKKYTAEDLKKLKGPGNQWGYPGEIDKLKPGAVLQVFIYKKAKKTVTRVAPKGSLAPKKEDGEKEKAKEDDEKPTSKSKETAPAMDEDDDGTDPVVKVVYVRQESTQPDRKSPKK